MIAVHTDHVGSLLRPPDLLRARERFARGTIGRDVLRAAEDAAIDRAVALQEEAGCEVITDGEMRRLSFQSQMTEAVEGFGEWDLDAFLWGRWRGEGLPEWNRARPARLGAVGRLARRRFLSVDEFLYLRDRTRRIAKITLPSPGLFANFWSPEQSRDAYPRLDDFLEDVARILREEVAELARMGCAYIQIDAPHYPLLLDPGTRAFYERQGWSLDAWLSRGIALDNAVMGDHPGVTFGFHLCRGNQGSRWLVSGGYGPIAERLFREVRAERLLLEFDDARSGDFEPLRHVPEDRMVVLGLVTTKTPGLEPIDALEARVRKAARIVPLDRLALSPQCGFSTSVIGNSLTEEEQRAKLRRVTQAARAIWGQSVP
jgi:5-methyltetrahydropteroyltriglutamate--homocysteine methyltransferase